MYLRLHPKCSSTPQMLMGMLGLIAGVSILIGIVFWVIGAPWILPFALLESLLLGGAFVCHATTRSDCDEITLNDLHLIVRQERRGLAKEHCFNRGLFCVSMTEGPQSRVRVIESGRQVELGEWLLPQDRLSLYKQLVASTAN